MLNEKKVSLNDLDDRLMKIEIQLRSIERKILFNEILLLKVAKKMGVEVGKI